jgi:hypothetical protein
VISTTLKTCSILLFTTTIIVGGYVFYSLYLDLSSLSFSVSSKLNVDASSINLILNVTYTGGGGLRSSTITLTAGNYSETRILDFKEGSIMLSYTIPLEEAFSSGVYLRLSLNYMNIVKINIVSPKINITRIGY